MKLVNNRLLVFTTILVYVLCNSFMIASPGVWWDDWTIYNADPNTLWNQFVVEGGQPIIGRFHYWALQNIDKYYIPLLYHWISFFLGGVSLLVTWHILRRFRISEGAFCGLILLIASTPLCSARISIACLFYPLTGVLFMLGVLFFLIYIDNNKLAFRILAFVSFMIGLCIWLTSAVLIPVFVFFMAVYVQKKKISLNGLYVKQLLSTLVNWWEFCLIPIFILILRKLFFMPTGRYSDYEITIEEWLRLPIEMIKGLYGCTVGYVKSILRFNFNDTIFIIAILFIIFICIYTIYKLFSTIETSKILFSSKRPYLFFLALILFFAAIMPSSTMSSANMGGYTSRYYVLAVVPFAIIILLILSYLQRHIFIYALGLIIGLNISINIGDQLLFQKQWIKDNAIAEFFKKSQISKYDNILFFDNAKLLNAYNDQYRYYEYCGIYKTIRPDDQTHFMADSEWAKHVPENLSLIQQELINCKEAKNIDIFQKEIAIDVAKDIKINDVFYSLYLYYLDNEELSKNSSSYFIISARDI